jgi:hypothetical protein
MRGTFGNPIDNRYSTISSRTSFTGSQAPPGNPYREAPPRALSQREARIAPDATQHFEKAEPANETR